MASKVQPRHTLSYQLREIIDSRGLTPYAAAKLADVDPGMVSRWMNGRRDIRMDTADKLALALGLRLTETPGGRSTAVRPAMRPARPARPKPVAPIATEEIEPTIGPSAEPTDGRMAEGGVDIEVTPAHPSDPIQADIAAMTPEPRPCALADPINPNRDDGNAIEPTSEPRFVASLPAPGDCQSADSGASEPMPSDADHPRDDHGDGPSMPGNEADDRWWQ
jgi:transcriptional regulator with XRE-family HTH domain